MSSNYDTMALKGQILVLDDPRLPMLSPGPCTAASAPSHACPMQAFHAPASHCTPDALASSPWISGYCHGQKSTPAQSASARRARNKWELRRHAQGSTCRTQQQPQAKACVNITAEYCWSPDKQDESGKGCWGCRKVGQQRVTVRGKKQ